jgi:Flp pilus assembly pilin Flp
MNLKKHLLRLVTDERGQSTTEYILILSVVVMIAMKFKTTFGEKLIGITTKVGSGIEDQVERNLSEQ